MASQQFTEKDTDGKLQGLILLWNCAYCEIKNTTWLIRKEAALGKKYAFCTSCEGKNLVKFFPSDIMSDREKIVQEALPFIRMKEQKEIFENLAWTESLFAIEGYEKIAESFWESLQREINYWVQQDQHKHKK